jgi:endonuclease G
MQTDYELLSACAQRYKDRSPERKESLKRLSKEGVAAVEDPERLKVRDELLKQAGVAEPLGPTVLEQVIGPTNDLLPLRYLEMGLQKALSVCRIEIHNSAGGFEGYGTGFLVSPSLLMTNNHVLPTPAAASRSLAEFNYEDDAALIPRPTKIYRMDVGRFFFTDKKLDFALVAVQPQATDGTAITENRHLPLIAESGKAVLGETVSVVQHPQGQKKQIALRANRVIDVFDDFVHYETDTMPGSSGSPVFNDQWDVVALHHSGVPRRNAAGRILDIKGRVWKEEMGVNQVDWVANEGIRISSIVRLVQETPDWTAEQQAMLDQMITHVV